MIRTRLTDGKLGRATHLYAASAAFLVAILVARPSLGTVPVDIVSSEMSGASLSCNGADNQLADNQKDGISYNGSFGLGLFANPAAQDWRSVLALLYGGVDLTAPGTPADCNSSARQALVANWAKLFQDGGNCPGDVANCGPGTAANGGIWHAFRPGDGSDAAVTFADAIGLSPEPSSDLLPGGFIESPFGRSPYCNAMNWDSTLPLDANGNPAYAGGLTGQSLYPAAYDNSICETGPHDQFTGPGGVSDPNSVAGQCTTSGHCEGTSAQALGAVCTVGGAACGNGSPCNPDFCTTTGTTACAGHDACQHVPHRMPPSGLTINMQSTQPGTVNVGGQVWGSAPQGIANTQAWDVLPTQMQDNDPIRQACIGPGVFPGHPGEDVCNLDGSLGVVLPIVETSWLAGASFNGGPALSQYPTQPCNGAWGAAQAPQVINCAPRGFQHHDGECPNGDREGGGLCQAPINNQTGTSSCANSAAQTATNVTGLRTLPRNYGRVYNAQMRDGRIAQGFKFAEYPIFFRTLVTTVDLLGAYYRIHETETIVPGAPDCQEADVPDQVACLTSADSCSVGTTYNGDAQNWTSPQLTDGLRVNQIYPSDPGYPAALTCIGNPNISVFQVTPTPGTGYAVTISGQACPGVSLDAPVSSNPPTTVVGSATAASDGTFTMQFNINNSSLCNRGSQQLTFEVSVSGATQLEETDLTISAGPC